MNSNCFLAFFIGEQLNKLMYYTHLVLNFLSQWAVIFQVLVIMSSFLAQEHENVASDLSSKHLLSGLVVKVNNEWKSFGLDEF